MIDMFTSKVLKEKTVSWEFYIWQNCPAKIIEKLRHSQIMKREGVDIKVRFPKEVINGSVGINQRKG